MQIIGQFPWFQLLLKYVLERLVASQLNGYCEDNQLLSPYQGAYHSGRSTEQILLFAVNTIVNALDHRWVCVLPFLTLGKHLTLLIMLCCWSV